jgi:hypothetical protein
MLYDQGAVDSSPAAEAGWVYFVTAGGELRGIEYAPVGTPRHWEQTLPGSPSSFSSPAVSGGVVYVFSGNELVEAPAQGGQVTTRALPGGGAGDATPAIHDGVVYFVGAADGMVYAIPPQSQRFCKSSETTIPPALSGSSPAVSDEGSSTSRRT